MFKLIGPVLIKQDLVEAKSNVQKRLEFIQNETERLDKMVKSMENKQETKHREILELQKKLQTLAAAKKTLQCDTSCTRTPHAKRLKRDSDARDAKQRTKR